MELTGEFHWRDFPHRPSRGAIGANIRPRAITALSRSINNKVNFDGYAHCELRGVGDAAGHPHQEGPTLLSRMRRPPEFDRPPDCL
jgi:hypothetical protein